MLAGVKRHFRKSISRGGGAGVEGFKPRLSYAIRGCAEPTRVGRLGCDGHHPHASMPGPSLDATLRRTDLDVAPSPSSKDLVRLNKVHEGLGCPRGSCPRRPAKRGTSSYGSERSGAYRQKKMCEDNVMWSFGAGGGRSRPAPKDTIG
jgi:hypothetical protein